MGEQCDHEYSNNHSNHHKTHHRKYEDHDEDDRAESDSSVSSSMKITYSVNSQSEFTFALSSAEKAGKQLSFVQQMRLKFENGETAFRYRPPSRFLPPIPPPKPIRKTEKELDMSQENLVCEVPSEDEVDDFGESEIDTGHEKSNESVVCTSELRVELQVPEILVDEVSNGNDDGNPNCADGPDNSYLHDNGVETLRNVGLSSRPFSEPVPEATNRHVVYKSYSCKESKSKEKPATTTKDQGNSIESHECHIINELIATEQSYVDTLKRGVRNYVNLFEDEKDLPANLKGKKYFLFGNIEQIVELHENELLPMFKENRNEVTKICKKFYELLMENRFYGYVLYAINKSNSEKLCLEEKLYFKGRQDEAGDKLGIDSFLVQPIQRLPRYGLLFYELISKYFKGDVEKFKAEVDVCCKVEKNIRNLLETVNSAMQINDIQECNDINLLYQGCFKRCFDLTNYDHAVRRSYKCRLFIFERSVVYTEIIKEKKLLYRGYYPRERIGVVVGKKNFSLFYQKRKVQECDFSGDSQVQDQCVKLVMSMMKAFAIEEKEKIQEKYQKVNDVFRRPGPRLHLYPSSRYSNDSGVGSVYSSMSNTSDEANPRTTWYTETFLSPGV